MILENFWETMVLILLGNVRSLKFSEISRKIGLLIFPRTWYAWTICCLALDCSYRDEKLRQRIVLHDTKNCFQSTFKLYMKWHNQKVVKIINWLSFITPTSYYLVEQIVLTKKLLQMIAWVNGDVVYESTKSPNNFGGPKTHASMKNRTISEWNEFSI